jgi:pentatricopeptide repeat protein
VATSRKEQLVILERVLHCLEEALNGHMKLNAHVWNSVIHVAARSQQLQRAFQVLDQMQAAGVAADEHTYGSLIEACVLAKEPELALRLFENALREVGRCCGRACACRWRLAHGCWRRHWTWPCWWRCWADGACCRGASAGAAGRLCVLPAAPLGVAGLAS